MKISRNVFIFGIVSFFNDMSTEMIRPVLPIFLSQVLGVPKTFIGVIEGFGEASVSIWQLISGRLTDTFRRYKLFTAIGYIFSTTAKVFFAFTTQGWHVLIVRVLDRSGKGFHTPPRDTLLSLSGSDHRFGRSFGFHRMMDTLGAVVGPLITALLLGTLAAAYIYQKIFLLAVIPGIIAVVLLILFVRDVQPEDHEQKIAESYDHRFSFFLIIVAIFSLSNFSDAFLILRAENVGVRIAFIPIIYMAFNLVYAGLSVPFGILSDKIGRPRVILFGFLVFVIAHLLFAKAQHQTDIWIAYLLYGVFYGATEGNLRAFVADLSPVGRRGRGYGAFTALSGIMVLPASIIAGTLWDRVSPDAPFYYGSLLALVVALLWIIYAYKTPEVLAK